MRVKRGNQRKNRRKKILKLAKGYWGTKSKAHRVAKQAVDRAGQFAYRDRRQKKRQMRSLWIVRINAAAREHGLSYSRLMAGLRVADAGIDRKMLAELAATDPAGFAAIATAAKAALGVADDEPVADEAAPDETAPSETAAEPSGEAAASEEE